MYEINQCTNFHLPGSCGGWIVGPWINPAWQKQFSMRLGGCCPKKLSACPLWPLNQLLLLFPWEFDPLQWLPGVFLLVLFCNGIWLICILLDPWGVVWKLYLVVDTGFWRLLRSSLTGWMHCWQLKALYSYPAYTSDHGSSWWARFRKLQLSSTPSCHGSTSPPNKPWWYNIWK